MLHHYLKICLLLSMSTLLLACGGNGNGSVASANENTSISIPDDVTGTPSGGTLIIPNNAITSASLWGGNDSQPVGTMSVVNVEHEKFNQALEIDVTNPSGVSWNGHVSIPVTAEVKTGDKVLLHLFFRTTASQYETGTGFTNVLLQGPSPDYVKLINRNVNSASAWVEYFFPATVSEDFADGELQVIFELGGGDRPQTYQIAGVELTNFQQSLALNQLPETKPSYGGRDVDAIWRAAAEQRIEQHRKGDFTLTIQTATGENIAITNVDIEMTNHAYHFGSAVVSSMLIGTSSDEKMYQQKVVELFNQAGPENDLKWAPWIGEWGGNFNQTDTLAGLQWLQDRDFYTRGHVLVWPSKRNLPNMMQKYLPEDVTNADPQALVEVSNHIDDVTLKTAALLNEWDVINEPFDNHYLMDAFGDQVMVDWFNRARINLPEQKLYINDYSILSAAGLHSAHQNHYEKTIQYLLDNNAAIDGLGLQSHFSEVLTDIPTLYNIIDRYHQAFPTLDIRSTEFDIKTLDQQLQADYTRDFLTIFFSHPATVGVQLWGFWQGRHWYPDAALYDLNWNEKPNAVAWKTLINDQWHSSFNGKTDEQGQYTARGFYGDYQVIFNYQDKSHSLTFSIDKNSDNNIVLMVEP
ncbi:MAG: endo-1,4-beta-xylanase [Colwellia sp.]